MNLSAPQVHPRQQVSDSTMPETLIKHGSANDLLCDDPIATATPAASYISIAKFAVDRGFTVTPVHPLEKRAVLYGWNRHPASTLSEICQHAKDFPNHNVGIVSRRGLGNHCFLDIDAPGVVEQIEQSGHTIPLTYTVQSRPNSAPWKKHFYFLQTSYSLAAFKKETNVKDVSQLTISDKGNSIHPTLYDLKGVGGGGLVVAANSARKDGELYTVLHDLPVIDIPNWLVDWLAEDIHKYRSACAKERHERATKVAELSAAEKAVLQKAGDENGFDVSEADIFAFLNWRAGTFASLGLERKTLKQVLTEQVKKFCAGGEKFVDSDSGKDLIKKVAFNKNLRIGNANFFNRIGRNKRAVLHDGLKFFPDSPTRKSLLVGAMKNFPDAISAEKGYKQLRDALAGTGLTLKSGKAGQKAAADARKSAGFRAQLTGSEWTWIRNTEERGTSPG